MPSPTILRLPSVLYDRGPPLMNLWIRLWTCSGSFQQPRLTRRTGWTPTTFGVKTLPRRVAKRRRPFDADGHSSRCRALTDSSTPAGAPRSNDLSATTALAIRSFFVYPIIVRLCPVACVSGALYQCIFAQQSIYCTYLLIAKLCPTPTGRESSCDAC